MVTRGFKIKLKRNDAVRIGPSKVMLYVIMLLLVAFTALPLIYVISTAFKPVEEILLFPPNSL